MLKKFFTIFLLLFVTGCGTPGTALLGPAFTGATTKSVAQASLSFGTNQIMSKIHEDIIKSRKQVKKIVKKIDKFKITSQYKEFFHFHR